MKTRFLFAPAVLLSLACLPARASEIPPGMEAPAALEARSLDRVEAAELAKSDPNQKGGDAVVAVAVIAAIVVLVWLAIDHLDHKP